jgi:hypothetical protein
MNGPAAPSTPPSPSSPSLAARLFRRRQTSPAVPRGEPAVRIQCHDRVTFLRIAGCLRRLGGLPSSWDARRYAFGSLAARDQALAAVRSDHGWTTVEAVEAVEAGRATDDGLARQPGER